MYLEKDKWIYLKSVKKKGIRLQSFTVISFLLTKVVPFIFLTFLLVSITAEVRKR